MFPTRYVLDAAAGARRNLTVICSALRRFLIEFTAYARQMLVHWQVLVRSLTWVKATLNI